MTIGEKIRYLRERMGITQSKLAEVTGIHPVSIRKYETNKMEPQQTQVERISDALNVSPSAILGIGKTSMRLETYGDLMGVIMVLHNSNILIIDGVRDEKNKLKPETVQLKINPVLKSFLDTSINNDILPLTDILFNIKNKTMLSDLIRWEKINRGYEECAKKYSNASEKVIQNTLVELKNSKDAIEIELQRSAIMLDKTDGLKVKIPPNFA